MLWYKYWFPPLKRCTGCQVQYFKVFALTDEDEVGALEVTFLLTGFDGSRQAQLMMDCHLAYKSVTAALCRQNVSDFWPVNAVTVLSTWFVASQWLFGQEQKRYEEVITGVNLLASSPRQDTVKSVCNTVQLKWDLQLDRLRYLL